MIKSKRRAQRNLDHLKAAQERVLIWAFREIAYLYQLLAISGLKNVSDKMGEPRSLASRFELLQRVNDYYAYLAVAETTISSSSLEFSSAIALLPGFLSRAGAAPPPMSPEQMRCELNSIIGQICEAQCKLPRVYVFMSDHTVAQCTLRRYAPQYRPKARIKSSDLPDSMVSVILAIVDTCCTEIHRKQTKDQQRDLAWTPPVRYKKTVKIMARYVSELLQDNAGVLQLDTSLQELERIAC